MFDHRETDEKELNALNLIDRAEDLADQGNGSEAINIYEEAAQIYLDLGSYMKLDDLYIRIAEIISLFKDKIQSTYRLKSIIRKTEQLELYEISAKLLIQLGNVSYKMMDWETAGESWQTASEYLIKEDPKEYDNLSSLLLLKAGQAFEKSHIKKDLGKRLILQAVMKMNKFDELYETDEKRALHFLVDKNILGAAHKFREIADHFRKALDNLGEILDADEEESKETFLTAKARLIHFIAEYLTITAICYRALDKPDREKINELSKEALELFKQSIALQKDYLFTVKKDYHVEEILRVTFDTMLMAIVEDLINAEKITAIELILKDTENYKTLNKKIKESLYFKIAEQIEKVGLINTLEKILDVKLGHFEEIKNTLISYFQ